MPRTLNSTGARPEVCFVIYSVPGAYPPLINAAAILDSSGYDISIVGADWPSVTNLSNEAFASCFTRMMPAPRSRILMACRHITFWFWATFQAMKRKGAIIYLSDPATAPVGLLLKALRRRVLYHEHDAPSAADRGWRARITGWFRVRLISKVPCVAPSRGRAALLQDAGATNVIVAHNYPSRADIAMCKAGALSTPPDPPDSVVRVLYQGSVVPERIPFTVVDALALMKPVQCRLEVRGYDPLPRASHSHALACYGRAKHVDVRVLGPKNHGQVLSAGIGAAVGISFFPSHSHNANHSSMPGASNKPFEYLLQGATPLLPDRPEWRSFFGDLASYCDPSDPFSISGAIHSILAKKESATPMHTNRLAALPAEWNYEDAFNPVLTLIASGLRTSARQDH